MVRTVRINKPVIRGVFRRVSGRWRIAGAIAVLILVAAAHVPSAWHDEGREHICRVCKIGHQTFLSFSVNFLFKVPERFECLAPTYQVPSAQPFFAE